MQIATHHHIRHSERKSSEQETKWKRLITVLAYLAGILGPLFTIDQVFQIWAMKNAAGVSFLTWTSNFFFSVIWTLYGITYKEKAVIVTNAMWVLMNGLVALGVWMYG